MSHDSTSQQVLERIWTKMDLNSSRIKSKRLHYAMEGTFKTIKYIQMVTGFSWYSSMPHSLIHITTFFLSHCGFGERDEIYPILQPLGIPFTLLFSMELSEPLFEYS